MDHPFDDSDIGAALRDPEWEDGVSVNDAAGAWADIDNAPDVLPVAPSRIGPYEDEFTNYLRMRHAAQNLPGHGPQDDLATEVGVKHLEKQQAAQESPWVNTNPISAADAGCILGGSYEVASGGQTQKAVFWQGEDHQAKTVTIQLSIVDTPGGYPLASGTPGTYSYRPYAIITYGTRNASHQRTVDIGRGTSITLSAAAVAVEVGLDAPQSGRVAGTARINATLGFEARNTVAPVQRTAYIDALANAGATQRVVVPQGAVGLLPVQVDDAAPSLVMAFQDTNNTTRYSLTLAGQGQQITPIPIAGDIRSILLTNNGAAASVNGALVFMLSL